MTMKTTTSLAAHRVAVVLAVLAATASMALQQLSEAAIHPDPDPAPAHTADTGRADEALQYGRHRRYRGFPIPSPPSSPAPRPRPRPRPLPTPTPTPPPPIRFCNRTIAPEGVAPMSVTGGDGLDDCVPLPAPTPRAAPPRGPCFCPRWAHPVFPGVPAPGTGSSAQGGSPAECVMALAGLMTCGSFLTGTQEDTPTPQSECCTGLGAFLNASSAAGDADRTLRCLCPVILGDVNKVLPKPMDPVRLMYLPIACGVVLPPQVLYICFTGQQTPPLVGRIPDVWEKPTSAALSP